MESVEGQPGEYNEPLLSEAIDLYLLENGFTNESMTKAVNVLRRFDAVMSAATHYALVELGVVTDEPTSNVLRLPPRRDDYPHPDSA